MASNVRAILSRVLFQRVESVLSQGEWDLILANIAEIENDPTRKKIDF